MDEQFEDCWSFCSFPGIWVCVISIIVVSDCHLCSMELLFAFGLMTEGFFKQESDE